MGILGCTDTDYIFANIYQYRSLIRYRSYICQAMLADINHTHSFWLHYVVKLLQHLYNLKVVKFDNIYNFNTEKYLKITVSNACSN